MKSKTLLLLAVIAAIQLPGHAEEDITPSRYLFSEQTTGQFTVNATNAGANPPAGWTVPVDNYNNGFLVLAGGPAVFTGLTAAQPAAIQEGLTITDLGGTIGKVLVLRGKSSAYTAGTAMGAGYNGAWFNMNFYADKTKTPTVKQYVDEGMSTPDATKKATVRVRLVFSLAENTISPTGSFLGKFYTSNAQNNTSPTDFNTHSPFPSDAFQATDQYGDPLPNDNGEAYYDPTKWMLYEFDTTVPEPAGLPNRLKIELTATAGNGTLLIKELRFIKEPTGDPVTRKIINYTPGTTGLDFLKTISEKLQVAIDGHQVQLVNIPAGNRVSVYDVTGSLVKEIITTSDNQQFELANGLYIIRSGNKNTKISIR